MDARILNGKIYDNSPFGGVQIGSIRNGTIYEGTWMGGNSVGRIRENGEIVINGTTVGRINDNNEINTGTFMGGQYAGRITDSGVVIMGAWLEGKPVGRIEFDPVPTTSPTPSYTSSNDSAPYGYVGDDLSENPIATIYLILGTIALMVIAWKWGSTWSGGSIIVGPFLAFFILAIPFGIIYVILLSVEDKFKDKR